jgi:hypothetical protein
MAIPLREVPIALRRRAAQHLESLRTSDLATRVSGLKLADEAWPLYRPDMKDIAYFEFPLRAGHGRRLVTTGSFPGERTKEIVSSLAKTRPESGTDGFIIVSTGEHDSPIPHWSLERPAPSEQLRQTATEGEIAKIYKLDALAYCAESQAGALIARIGQFPVLPEGLPHDLLKMRGGISSFVTERGGEIVDDSKAEGVEHREKREGMETPFKLVEPSSWEDYRARYANAFGPLLDAHRRRVARAWSVEREIAELGEGVIPGAPHRVALLEPGAAVALSGPGARFIEVKLIDRAGGPGAVELHAIRPPEAREVGFALHLTYASGETETLQFFVLTRDTPSNTRTPRPDRSPEVGP